MGDYSVVILWNESFHNVKQLISQCESSLLTLRHSFHIPFHMISHPFTIRFTILSVSYSFHSPFHSPFHMISHHFTFHFTGSFHIVSQMGNLRFTCFHKYEISISPNFTGYVKLGETMWNDVKRCEMTLLSESLLVTRAPLWLSPNTSRISVSENHSSFVENIIQLLTCDISGGLKVDYEVPGRWFSKHKV